MMKMMMMKKPTTVRLRMAQGGEGKTCRHLLQEEMDFAKFHFSTQGMLLALRISAFAGAIRHKVLCTLQVTSCSAQRALSRLRIIKNRLQSSMCDEWMKALMDLASEKDVLSS